MANNQPIRVLALMEAYSINGVAKGVLEFAREAHRRPADAPLVDVTLLTFRRGACREEPALQEAIRSSGAAWEAVEEQGRFDRTVMRQMREVAARQRAEIIWSNNVKSHFLVRLAGLHRERGWLAFHHGYTAPSTTMRLYNQLDRWSLPMADRVMTVCKPFAAQLSSTGVDPHKIHVQHMPIRAWEAVGEDCTKALRASLRIDPSDFIVLSVGRLSSEKGHADLLQSFALLRAASEMPVRLVLVGDGPERQRLEALALELKLSDAVRFAGQQSDVRPYYAIASLFALSSHTEGSPNVLLEAMCGGVPVVTTRVGGIPEMAVDNGNALMVEKHDHRAMAGAMQRILTEPALGERLVKSGRAVLISHAPEAYFRSIANVLQLVRSGRASAVSHPVLG